MATSYSDGALPPGFRFHPTDEELILHYLLNRASSIPCPVHVITDLDIYKFDPWDLPDKAVFGDKEWYFFTPRDRKYPNGMRPNRAARTGYWKATGTDKPISTTSPSGNMVTIGVKKALVFYVGKPPRGTKSNWIMHEYRLAGPHAAQKPTKILEYSMRLDDWVLCRIYKKNNQPSVNPQVNKYESPKEVFPSPIPMIAPPPPTSAAGDADLFSMMMMVGGEGSHGQTFQVDGEALGAPLTSNKEGCFERNRRSMEGHSYILQQSSTAAYMQMLMGSHLDTGENQ